VTTDGLLHANADCIGDRGFNVSVIWESVIECVAEVGYQGLRDPLGVRGVHCGARDGKVEWRGGWGDMVRGGVAR
jgi:hypothetical protein